MEKKKRLDPWVLVSLIILALYLLFLIYPMFNVLRRSVADEQGHLTLQYFVKFFSQPYYLSTLGNSFKVSLATTVISLVLGVPLAYLYNMYEIKGRKFL